MAAKQGRSPKVPEIRKGDTVVVLAGKDAGKRGTVDRVIRREPSPGGTRSIFRRGSSAGGVSVVVEGINISKRHTKPRQGSTSGIGGVPRIEPGGILDVNHPAADRQGHARLQQLRQADAHRPSDARQRAQGPRLQAVR